MRKLIIGCAIVAAVSAVPVAASADSGNHLGQGGQACAAAFGFKSLGAGNRAVVEFFGNNAGGVANSQVADLCTGAP